MSVFSVVSLLVVTALLSFLFFSVSERVTEDKLLTEAKTAASQLEGKSVDEKISCLASELSGVSRYTLVAEDGKVLFDSVTDASGMDNHGNRPEIVMARQSGDAVSVRHSKTFDTDTLYAAVQLDDGSVIRLAQDHYSRFAFFSMTFGPLAFLLVLALAAVLLLSRRLAHSIIKPIDDLDVAHPLDNRVYAEMEPLLDRISQQQERLLEQNRELAHVESMRRDFSSNVSHDMKTPVHAISGYAEILKSGNASPEDVQRFAGVIYDEAQMLRKLIDDVLTLSRLDEVSFDIQDQRIIDMKYVANRVCERLSILAEEKDVSLSCVPANDPVFVCGNEQMLEEMTCNLVENAIKYNKRGGMVRVKVWGEGKSCKLRVSDTGVGIPEDLQEKIFQRFYRPDKSRSKETGGTGLGLAIVKHVALRHNGSVEVESDESLGSAFTVTLPLLDDSDDEVL
ncbi:MAG: ATP-binding protein [Eggerthellaceae bacterium]